MKACRPFPAHLIAEGRQAGSAAFVQRAICRNDAGGIVTLRAVALFPEISLILLVQLFIRFKAPELRLMFRKSPVSNASAPTAEMASVS